MIEISNRNFWIAQLIGWGIFAGTNFLVQFLITKEIFQVILNSAIIFFGGGLITSVYRYFMKKAHLNLMKIGQTILIILIGTVVLIITFLGVISIVMLFMHERKFLNMTEILGNSFLFGIIMLIWNSIYFMIHYLHNWKNAESEKWKLEATIKEAQLGNLKAQINPHFMFNAINNIRALISEDADKAKDMLLNFSDMFRYSLIYNDKSLVNVNEEIQIVEKYLELLSIQFEEKLRYTIDIDQSLNELKIPPMMVQLLVENAVKHGISELTEGGVINIKGESVGDEIMVQVKNSGSLTGNASIQKKLGVGLKNIHERLQLIYGGKAYFRLTEEAGYVVAILTLPKNISE